jgi:hypothetical protein
MASKNMTAHHKVQSQNPCFLRALAMKPNLTPMQKIVYAIGTIVLCSQEIERQFKFLVPIILTNSDDPSFDAILKRHKNLSRRSLGEVAGQFTQAFTGDVDHLKMWIKHIVDQRNNLIHHFSDTYRTLLNEHKLDEILVHLKKQHRETLGLLRVLQEISLALAEEMRDSTFLGTEQFADMAALCEQAREQLAE